MDTLWLTSIIIGFNRFLLFYVLCINSIYFFQLILSAFSLYDYLRKMRYSDYRKYSRSNNMIPISVLVPAYNEAETIVDNVRSLLSLDYPVFEVIVINDGSVDNTLDTLLQAFGLREVEQPVLNRISSKPVKGIFRSLDSPNLIVADKENGGKADALNVGINLSRYPVFASIDADSILENDSLVRVIMPFIEDSRTAAVGGIVRVANGSRIESGRIRGIRLPRRRLALFQVVEYLRAFLTGRMGWDALGSLLIISGAFGAFRKDLVIEAGGYRVGTIGEDMELVVRLHAILRKGKKKYRIKFIPDPVCWTQAPERVRDLRNQRRRWQIGLMDSLFRHKKLLFNPRYGIIGIFAAPYFWFFEMLGPLVEAIGYVMIPLSYYFGLLNQKFFLLFVAVSILYGVTLSIGAILLEEYTFNKYPSLLQLFKLSWYGILENFGYRQLTTLFRVEGILRYRKYKNSWGKFKRHHFEEK